MVTTPSSTLRFTSTTASDGIAARTFTLGDLSGVLWPPPESATNGAPLLLMGHGGGLHKYAPGLVSRASRAVAAGGFTVAAIDAPGHGDRPRSGQDQPQAGAIRRAHSAGERALVLGGGGAAGNAWQIGVIAGLFDAGLDVTEADLIIGTSAGSTAAAQISSATQPAELLASILATAPQPGIGRAGSGGGRVPNRPVTDLLEKTSGIIAAAEDAADMRRRMGAAALEMDAASGSSGQTQRRATVAARLPSQRWPQRPMLIVAVDAHTGEPVVFDRHSGVDLVDAVTASCAGPGVPPTVSAATGTSTAATGPTRMPIWQPDTGGCWCCHHLAADHVHRWSGECILQRRPTNYGHAAAESKPSSRIAAPATHSAPI